MQALRHTEDTMLLRPGSPLISAADVKHRLSPHGYSVANAPPAKESPAADPAVPAPPTEDPFDHAAQIATLNPPDWAAFDAAVKAKDPLQALLSFKDILLSEKEQKKVTSHHLCQVLHLLSRCKPYPKIKFMLEMLEYANQIGLPADIDSRNLLLEAYSRIGDYENARQVALTFADLNLTPNLKTYNLFLNLHIKDGNLPACIAFYERMIDEGIDPDVGTFNCLIQGCLTFNKLNRSESYFEDMIAIGINPDQRTIILLIQLYTKSPPKPGDASVVEKLQTLQQTYLAFPGTPAPEGKVEPNSAIYTSLIKSYAQHGRLDLARFCFQQAKTLPDADAQLYTAMLHSLVESGNKSDKTVASVPLDLDSTTPDTPPPQDAVNQEAMQLFQEMMETPHLQVDSIAFATLVQMFVRSRDLERAETIVNVGMKARGIPVTIGVWSALLEGYVEAGRVSDAVRLFEQLKMEGAHPPVYLYNMVLKGLAADFDVELVERYWGRWLWSIEMEEAEIRRLKEQRRVPVGKKSMHGLRKTARPDAESYSIVIDAFVACQDIDRAMTEIQKMLQTTRFVPLHSTFVALIQAHVRRRDYRAAAETMLMMRKAVVEKDGVDGLKEIVKVNAGQFEALVVGLLERSDALRVGTEDVPAKGATAHDLAQFKEFAQDSVERVHEMKTKRVLGVELYKEMIAAGCSPSEETFACVIRAHNHAGDLVSGIKAWLSFRSLHPTTTPSPATINALLHGVKSLGKQATSRAVVDIVKSDHLVLDSEGFGLYFYMLSRWGWKEELMSSVVDLINAGFPVSRAVVAQMEEGLKLYAGPNAAAIESEVMRFVEENWPEALGGDEEEEEGVEQPVKKAI
ncbi:hypothetical protein HDU98_010405 [Podochytrium sp. JEL0797]|nr:hypothetical protein HDU98_010405 [Podochytrium sp. JEL0797]